jgi:hypothetical protein
VSPPHEGGRPREGNGPETSPVLKASPTQHSTPLLTPPATITPVPDAHEVCCDLCGWWCLRPTLDEALARYAVGHECGGAS